MKNRFLILCVVLLTVPVFASPVGDLNEDWTVDLADLVIFAEDWLTFPGCPVGEPTCTDLIGGDRVDMTDFALFMENWFLTETPTLVINEFMASNDTTIADSYGEYDDWIEIYNYGTQNINMAGMQLRDSDNTYTIPDDPNALIAPSEYKLFWADNDKLPDQGPLHTNFKLGASGDDIYLFNKNGLLIDSKTYNADQVADISHGRFPDKDIDWYNMDDPTPGAANTAGMASDVWFSKLSGTFTSTFNLQLFTETPDATIRYTTNGSAPTSSSAIFPAGGLSIGTGGPSRIRAQAYHATLAPSNVISHYYTPVASDVQNFTSNLPIVIIETHNNGIGDEFGNAMSTIFIDVNQDTGLASMTDIPDFAGRSGLHIRGESSAGWPKKQYALELWDDNNEDRKASLLGMPAESDWVLNAPYSDKTLMRNVLAFKWANDIGKGFAAPGTRLVEVFLNDDGGSCSYSDYNGIYVLMEKIKVSENRLDIGNLQVTDNTEPEITGGYILRVDKNYQGEFGQFYTSANILNNPIQYFDPGDNLITPNPNDITNAQKTWIGNWLDGFESNLNSSSFDDPINGYAQYIDVESFIEYDIIAEIFKNADGLKLSTYFHKKKNGKLAFGPHWDYNLSTGNASEGCWEEYGAGYPAYMEKASTSEGWFNQTMPVYGWHEKLLLDSDYELRTADKWFEHREDKLSDAQIAADIDLFYGMVTENHTFSGGANNAADRNFTQWPNLDTWIHCNSFLGSTYISHIDRLRTWLHGNGTPKGDYSDRMQHVDDLWLSDRNIAAPPTLWINGSPMNTGGTITAGSTLTMTGSAGTIYYTTDGVDPRVFKGSGTINNIILVAESDAKKVLVPTSEVTGSSSTGSILREYWTGISGTSVSNLTSNSNFPNVPTGSDLLTTFEAPIDWADDYGTRIRGYLHPPTTKNYTFWVSGDDETQLWLSTDANPSNATQIAYVPDWTSSREWDKHGSQQSDLITLAAGQQYYIEVLHKEGNGGDNIAVAWDESGSLEIIDGAYLSQEGGQVWAGEGFDDSSWTSGSGGVGYEDSPSDTINFTALIDTDVQSAMSGVNPTCYIRIPFTVTGDPALFTSLSLNVRYDDGFIAYINGSEIKRVNADPGEPAWNSSASTYRSSDSLALDLESFDISGSIGTLKSGANVLAIQGLNSSAGSSDFLISASLTGSQDVAGTVYANAIEYTGDVTLNETTQIKARVRDTSGNWTALNEAIFSESRLASSLRITEIMYNPVDPNDEFIEFTNIGASTVNLAHCRLTKGVDFTFPDYGLAPNDHVLVVRNLAAFSLLHPTLVSSIAGEYTNDKLDNGGETIRLKDAAGVIIQEFEYEDGWFPITDGLSYSLNIINPNDPVLDNWNKRLSWEASNVAGGTPGADHTNNAVGNEDIVINEILTHTDDSEGDWIELHNTTGSSIDVGGWYLSDDKDNLKKYKIASPTNISGGGYLVLTATTHFQNASNPGSAVTFGLSEHGESVFLTSGNGSDIAGGYSDGESFGSSKNDVTFGRYTKGAPTYNTDFIELTSMTQGASNSAPYVPDVVISEILYNAQGIEDQLGEYIELYNRSGSTVYLYDTANPSNTWRLTKGAEFQFPTGVSIGGGQRILISRTHPETFKVANGDPGVAVYGPFTSGTELANDGEKIELSMPTDPDPGTGFISYIRVEQVNYSDGIHPLIGDPWPTSADGRGDSLHRTTLSDYANDVANWSAAAPTPGS